NLLFFAALAFISDASSWVVNAIPALANMDVGPGHCGKVQFEAGNVMPLFTFFDCLIYFTFMGPAQYATIKLVGLFTALILVYPPLSGMAWYWATTTFLTMTRAVISFLLALGAIAFLVSLSPIFFSFMLFQTTMYLFDSWLRYIISYCLQVVFTFAVIVMWILVFIKFLAFFAMLSEIIFPFQPLVGASGVDKPAAQWAICPPTYDFTATGAPTIACEDDKFDPYKRVGPGGRELNPGWVQDSRDLVAPSKMIKDGQFLYFLFFHLISLIIVTYAFGTILEHVPELAQKVSTPAPLPVPLAGLGKEDFGNPKAILRNPTDGVPQAGAEAAAARTGAAGATGRRVGPS
ncbi:MAG: type IV secretion system protein, partial [Rickettsiales bacterium]|nr:type IV secretion system protein [Rickettsiales bacterium]